MTGEAAKIHSHLLDTSAATSSDMIHRAAIIMLLARRAIWMTALCRVAPRTLAIAALSSAEIALLDRMARGAEASATLASALTRLASIGGGAREPGRAPSPFSVARGLSRLADRQIAARLRAAKYVEQP